jgi:tetrahydromethanopterin S-methyltransferase subunit E
MAMHVNAVLAIVLGSVLAVFVQGVYATTAYLGRTASLAKFGQPVYIDVIKSMTSVTMAHAFIAIFCTVTLCHLINVARGGRSRPDETNRRPVSPEESSGDR